jgi:hypothetical protein
MGDEPAARTPLLRSLEKRVRLDKFVAKLHKNKNVPHRVCFFVLWQVLTGENVALQCFHGCLNSP